MDFGPLFFCFVTQQCQFKAFFPDLDIVTEEENGGEEAKSYEIKSNLKGLFVYSEVASLGSLLAKDEDIKVIFIQNNLLVSLIHNLNRILRPLFKYQSKYCRVKFFFAPPLPQASPLRRRVNYCKFIFNFR